MTLALQKQTAFKKVWRGVSVTDRFGLGEPAGARSPE